MPEREVIMFQLPKNVMQIGQSNPHCKVYMEDYVHTFLKQRKREEVYLAFGKKEELDGVRYYLIYGAEKKTDWDRGSIPYFKKMDRLGTLEGTAENRIFRPNRQEAVRLDGYFVFYEQNEDMQSYMITVREKEEMQKERETEKEAVMEAVRIRREVNANNRQETKKLLKQHRKQRRQMERKQPRVEVQMQQQENRENKKKNQLLGKVCCTALFLALSVVGIRALGVQMRLEEVHETIAGVARNLKQEFLEEKMAVQDTAPAVQTETEQSFFIIEETQWNPEEGMVPEEEITDDTQGEIQWTIGTEPESEEEDFGVEIQETEIQEEMAEVLETAALQERPEVYVVKRGDSLVDICRRFYGDTSRMYEICRMNNIADPNQIQRGQNILLP